MITIQKSIKVSEKRVMCDNILAHVVMVGPEIPFLDGFESSIQTIIYLQIKFLTKQKSRVNLYVIGDFIDNIIFINKIYI